MLENERIPKPLLALLALTVLLAVACGRSKVEEKEAAPSAVPAQPAAPAAKASPNKFSATFQSGDLASHRLVKQENGTPTVRVEPGSEEQAIAYLEDIKGPDHLPSFSGSFLDAKLDDLLAYTGYTQATVAQLEELDSRTLAEKSVDSTRFFAPKIINVQPPIDPNVKYGWRKVVRVPVASGSGADRDGIEALWVLFNYFSATPSFPDPLVSRAGALQAILERKASTLGAPKFPVYFFVAGPHPEYELGLYLEASFDAPAPPPRQGEDPAISKYYLPYSCAQCHGAGTGLLKTKINYLDTDHWFDRVQSGDSFSDVPVANVLPDGGQPGTSEFNIAFGVLRNLNERIELQNRAVDPDSFQHKAVQTWHRLHPDASSSSHIPPFGRSIAYAPDNLSWQETAQPDKDLLPMLNRYCFRCHSSFAYHVFDKKAVKDLSGAMKAYVQYDIMPQGQKLDAATKSKLEGLLDQLSKQ
jgi:hypothetical protein